MTDRALPAWLAFLAVLGGFAALVRERSRAATVGTAPPRNGEICVTCHTSPDEDPGGAHAAEAFGCASCHLGNPRAWDADRAHVGLEREPGALDTVDRTCGQARCHPEEARRVERSGMATGRGMIAVDRFAFGEVPTPDGDQEIAQVLAAPDPTPAEDHLRRLCLGCHLYTRSANRDDAVKDTGSGCGACHVLRTPGTVHPPLTARVPDDNCIGCHSRSGRVSLSYFGRAELKGLGQRGMGRGSGGKGGDSPLPGEDTEVHVVERALLPDVHAEAGVACIDCHVAAELMGTGETPGHAEDAVVVTCESCHGPALRTGPLPDDVVTRNLLRLRGLPESAEVRLLTDGSALWNVQDDCLSPYPPAPPPRAGSLVSKLGDRAWTLTPTPEDADHTLPGHARLGCAACHSVSTPWCGDCHTRYEPGGSQWDFGTGKVEPGQWVETSKRFEVRAPALGVLRDRVVPVLPGMVMDLSTSDGVRSTRLFAPLDPHTTRKEARSCESCHAGPSAFRPTDAGTRTGLRALDVEEERRVLEAEVPGNPKVDPVQSLDKKVHDPSEPPYALPPRAPNP